MAKSAAQSSKEYRDRENAKAQALGVKNISIEVAEGVDSRLRGLMKQHGFKQIDELFQTVALNLAAAPSDVCAALLKRPDASSFQIKPKHARQLREFAKSGGIDAEE